MRIFTTLLVTIFCFSACAQTQPYKQSIADYRKHYKQEFLEDKRSPLTAKDTGYLKFYTANEAYKVTARLTLTPEAKPFDMPTASGKTKLYRQYGLLTFSINDTAVTLQVLQSLKLMEDIKHKNHLFVPFTDGTTYTETYGGGRYLDLSIQDISNNTIELDFNKCYNPWCAYAGGYSCPIPPKENRMAVSIQAGEKMFGKEVKH